MLADLLIQILWGLFFALIYFIYLDHRGKKKPKKKRIRYRMVEKDISVESEVVQAFADHTRDWAKTRELSDIEMVFILKILTEHAVSELASQGFHFDDSSFKKEMPQESKN